MPELLERTSPELTTLPLVIDGELTDYFGAPNLLEETPTLATESPAILAMAEMIDVDFTPPQPERPSLSNRFFQSKIGRLAMSGLTALGLAGGAVAVEASPAYAANPVYTVVNPDNDGTRSIYDRNSPHWSDTDRKYPDFSYYGDRLELVCGTNGDAVGPYNNKRWHYAKNLSRPEAGVTWIPDRYMNTPNKANQPTPGEAECGATAPKPPTPTSVKACYFNLKAPSKNLALSYAGDHRYYGNIWQAAKNWSDTGAGIKINPTKNNVDAYIRVKDVNVNESWYAKVDIPAKTDWMGPHKTVPSNPRYPKTLTLLMNKRYMDGLNDFERTLVATHELGHTLGLAHTNGPAGCNISNESIMKEGDKDTTFNRGFNTPTTFDKNQLKQLYGAS